MIPPEIVNHIYSYIQSATNQIMKKYFQEIFQFEYTPIDMLYSNRQYGFKRFNIDKYIEAYYLRCPFCNGNFWPDEYKRKILNNNLRFCSRKCSLEYDIAYYNYVFY